MPIKEGDWYWIGNEIVSILPFLRQGGGEGSVNMAAKRVSI